MSKVLFIGDLHLGKSVAMGRPGIGSNLNGRVADQFKLLDWLLEQAIQYHVSTMIFTGDVFENAKPDTVLVVHFLAWLKACEDFGITIHIVLGNHDLKRSGSHYVSVLDLIEAAGLSAMLHKKIQTIYVGSTAITLLPFRDRRSFNLDSNTQALSILENSLKYEAGSISDLYNKVLIGHLALEGSIPVGDEFDDSNNELMCPLSMFEGYRHVWMGHVHRPQVRSKLPYCAHIGSLDLSDFGETDHQKIIILYDSEFPDAFQEIIVPSRPLRRVKISVSYPDDATELTLKHLETLHKTKSLKNAILKIELQLQEGVEPCNRQLIEKVLDDYGLHYLCSFVESRSTTVVPQEKKQDLNNGIEPKEALVIWAEDSTRVSPEEKNEFLKLANEIIEQCLE